MDRQGISVKIENNSVTIKKRKVMGLLEFNKLPINTLVGADWKTFKAITAGREIDPAYRGKYRLTKAVCRLLSTLAPLQEKRYRKLLADKPLEHDPVFILGHWRSGTTFMHNVFSCDNISDIILLIRRCFLT